MSNDDKVVRLRPAKDGGGDVPGRDERLVELLRAALASAESGKMVSLAIAFEETEPGETAVTTCFRRADGGNVFALLGAVHKLAHRLVNEGMQRTHDGGAA